MADVLRSSLWRALVIPAVLTIVAVHDVTCLKVTFTETDSTLQTATCSGPENEKIVSIKLEKGGKLLEKVTSRCQRTPCHDESPVALASRGFQRDFQASLTVAWEPSTLLDARQDALTCSYMMADNDNANGPASVKTFPSRRYAWSLNKTGADRASSLVIAVQVGPKGQKRVGPEAGTSAVRFLEVGATAEEEEEEEEEEVMIVKVVDTPDFAAVTLLSSRAVQCQCEVKMGDEYTDCGEDTDCGALRLSEGNPRFLGVTARGMFALGLTVIAVILVVAGVVVGCFVRRSRKKKKPDHDNPTTENDAEAQKLREPIQQADKGDEDLGLKDIVQDIR